MLFLDVTKAFNTMCHQTHFCITVMAPSDPGSEEESELEPSNRDCTYPLELLEGPRKWLIRWGAAAFMNAGEVRLQTGSGDAKSLQPPPSDMRLLRVEQRESQRRSARLLTRRLFHPSSQGTIGSGAGGGCIH